MSVSELRAAAQPKKIPTAAAKAKPPNTAEAEIGAGQPVSMGRLREKMTPVKA